MTVITRSQQHKLENKSIKIQSIIRRYLNNKYKLINDTQPTAMETLFTSLEYGIQQLNTLYTNQYNDVTFLC